MKKLTKKKLTKKELKLQEDLQAIKLEKKKERDLKKKLVESCKKAIDDEFKQIITKTCEKTINNNFRCINTKLNLQLKKQSDVIDKIFESSNEALKIYKSFDYKVESFEETLLVIMHNIKKNQYLYSHYPDDWVKEFNNDKEKVNVSMKNCIKENMKLENKFMNEKSIA